jgi:glycosyltransferase involved in cell wall biosynthesis
MDRGGAETWLMHMLRAIDRRQFKFHFLVTAPGAYDTEIRSLGAQIHYHRGIHNPIKYRSRFRKILHEFGPFDVVHSHVYLYSGFLMRLAAEAGVPIRIAHSHTAPKQKPSSLARIGYERLMKYWIVRYSTECVGVSRTAAEALFGEGPGNKVTLLPYGLQFEPFLRPKSGEEVKARFGIPLSRKVIGHVGRFAPVKNHAFIVELFELAIKSGIDAHLLFVGDGALLPSIRREIEDRGLSNRCTFAGLQSDIASFLFAMDVFVLPSSYEGLGIVALEAQAAGVPVIASTTIPEEIDVIPKLVRRISLNDGAAAWASAAADELKTTRLKTGAEALLLQKSSFALPVCIEKLSRLYLGKRIGDLAA